MGSDDLKIYSRSNAEGKKRSPNDPMKREGRKRGVALGNSAGKVGDGVTKERETKAFNAAERRKCDNR